MTRFIKPQVTDNMHMMFLKKAAAFTIINTIILIVTLVYFSGKYRNVRLNVANTESNLLSMGKNQHYDFAILGTSRGRVFSRDDNHQRVEQLLDKHFINLAKGGGGGLMPAKVHLTHFYNRGNTVDQIFYLVDPWVFYSPINNEKNNFFLRDEPFEISILWQLVLDRYPLDTILSYIQKIAVKDWETISRYAGPGLTKGELKIIDTEKINTARVYYAGRYEKNSFLRYSQFVDKINKIAKNNRSKVTYIMLPLLIPNFPGIDTVHLKLQETAEHNKHVSYVNLSTQMQSPTFYYDHMHLNTKGILLFASQFLDPILNSSPPDTKPE